MERQSQNASSISTGHSSLPRHSRRSGATVPPLPSYSTTGPSYSTTGPIISPGVYGESFTPVAPRSTPSRSRGPQPIIPTIPRFPTITPLQIRSPRDTTAIEVNGQVLNREAIPPILSNIVPAPPTVIVPAPPTIDAPPAVPALPPPVPTPMTPDTPSQVSEPVTQPVIPFTSNPPRPSRDVPETPEPSETSEPPISQSVAPPELVPDEEPEEEEITPDEEEQETTPVSSTETVSQSTPSSQPAPSQSSMRSSLDYDSMSLEEQAVHRTDFRVKFGLLAGTFPNYQVPQNLDSLSLHEIEAMYERYVRHIYVCRSRDKYKIFLIIGCTAMEWFITKMLGLNASGYTMAQIRGLSNYDRLLIQLGERNYSTAESEWSLEVQILFMMGANAVIFVIANMVAGSLGEGVTSIVMQAISALMIGDTNIQPPMPPQTPQYVPPSPGTPYQAAPPNQVPAGPSPFPQPPPSIGGFDIMSMAGSLIRSLQQQPAPTTQAPPQAQQPQHIPQSQHIPVSSSYMPPVAPYTSQAAHPPTSNHAPPPPTSNHAPPTGVRSRPPYLD